MLVWDSGSYDIYDVTDVSSDGQWIVESQIVGSVVIRSAASGSPTILLDDTVNFNPNFAEFALQ